MDFNNYKGFQEDDEYDEDEEGDPKFRGGFLAIPLEGKTKTKQVALRFLEHTNEPTVNYATKDFIQVTKQVSRQEYVEDYIEHMTDVRFANEFNFLVEFGPSRQGYYSIMMEGQSALFDNFPALSSAEPTDKFFARMKRFIYAWVQVCEATKADFAFFSRGCCRTTQKWLKDCVLAPLNPLEPEDLLYCLPLDYWLTYLGPQLAPRIPDKVLQSLEDVKITRLPSGAIFIRNRLSPLVLADLSLLDMFFEQEIDFSDLPPQQ